MNPWLTLINVENSLLLDGGAFYPVGDKRGAEISKKKKFNSIR